MDIKFENVEFGYNVLVNGEYTGQIQFFARAGLYYYVNSNSILSEGTMSEIVTKLEELNFEKNLKIKFDKNLEESGLIEFKNSKLINIFINDIISTTKPPNLSVVNFYIGKLEFLISNFRSVRLIKKWI